MPAKLIVVVGLGEIGRPLFNIIKAAHPTTLGVDIEPVEIKEPIGILHLCFPFTLTNGFVATAVGYAKRYKPEVLVVNSTVVPGTCTAIEEACGVPTVYSPV